ncbi:hypothetical protein L917_11898 [Phytophthora nicotianae]|uniref:Uncharacterized protein n=1 Tax=Phytophthora nicotianae TaxID=4792 RepID=W2KVE5_PHYNI|nr:hypothetical protein L917_11898 [Phytophthora nicotianae]
MASFGMDGFLLTSQNSIVSLFAADNAEDGSFDVFMEVPVVGNGDFAEEAKEATARSKAGNDLFKQYFKEARKKAVYVGEYSDSFDLIARRIQVTDRDLSKELFHEASGVLKLTGARTFEFTDVFGVVTEFMVPSVHSQETRIIKVGCTQGAENRPKNLTNRSGKLTPKQLLRRWFLIYRFYPEHNSRYWKPYLLAFFFLACKLQVQHHGSCIHGR